MSDKPLGTWIAEIAENLDWLGKRFDDHAMAKIEALEAKVAELEDRLLRHVEHPIFLVNGSSVERVPARQDGLPPVAVLADPAFRDARSDPT